jgi:hypothetical protein
MAKEKRKKERSWWCWLFDVIDGNIVVITIS